MKIVSKLLDYTPEVPPNNVYLFTANGTIKLNGALVMGAGTAKAVRDTYKGSDKVFGKAVREFYDAYVYLWRQKGGGYLGSFRTKENWREPSDIVLISASCRMLKLHAEAHPEWIFHLPFPGIGLGGLDPTLVYPLIEMLPDNVLVYQEDK